MRKWMLIALSVVLLAVMMTGFPLARPEEIPSASSDVFCGFWLVYDREENTRNLTFDPGSEAEQTLLVYQMPVGDSGDKPAYTTKSGGSLGDVSIHMNVKGDTEEEIEVKGTLYVIPEKDQDLWMEADHEMSLDGDVVSVFADSLAKPEGGEDIGWIKPGQTALVYISPQQKEDHGQEMMDMAQKAGVTLFLKTQSPRRLLVSPVFMRPDGTMYADENGRHHIAIQTGTAAGYSMSVENKQTVNGATTKKRVSASISVKTVDTLLSVRLVEMGENNTPVKTSEMPFDLVRSLSKESAPYAAGREAAYVLVEETFEDAQGEAYVKRTAVSPEEGGRLKPSYTFYLPLGNGLTEAMPLNFTF